MEDIVFAANTVPDMETPSESCLIDGRADPCTVIIIGASGDLTGRKIVPALYELFCNGGLPDPCIIVGCARTRMDDSGFREKMKEAAHRHKKLDESDWSKFARLLYYRAIEYNSSPSFTALAESIKELEQAYGTGENRLFYLAIPPSLYETTSKMLGHAGLAREHETGDNWVRIVVEKPFGRDLASAMSLDHAIHEHWNEHQIFRIDHYLAKETVQNILMFRFANAIFEPIWNRRYIKSVKILVAESLGVEHRAGYYEQAGVMRDMFQNHMMQLLSLIAMEPPAQFDSSRVRDEKVKIYRALRPFPVQDLSRDLVLGQYAAGEAGGQSVSAYRDEPGVSPRSLVPTFARMRVFVDNWRWQGVPFVLMSGKRLAEKKTEIVIQFREIPHSMFRRILGEHISENRLVLGIYPEEKIHLTFQTKNPGAEGSGLELDLVSNPTGAFLPPSQTQAEKRFHDQLNKKWGIHFNHLYTFINVPLGRFRKWLSASGNLGPYMDRLAGSFNPCALDGVMCRTLISVDWEGYLYDCDFNLAKRLPIGRRKTHVTEMSGPPEPGETIAVGDHCYTCTAGSGFT
ncbi:MAG: glucose-6-phosphate dehydrogenase [Deltaproteobacteria bacterium]|nr:glucose-6-phosphate dehydrogenase [Deltaproteobacteria bacterium]